MASSANQSLGDALLEIETVLKIRRKLEEMAPKSTIFGERWMDNILRIKIQALESTSSGSSNVQNLNYMGRMPEILDALINRKLDDMVDQLTMALVRHKSSLDPTHRHLSNAHEHGDALHSQYSAANTLAFGRGARKDFDVIACSSRLHKFYSTDGQLWLSWHEELQVFHVFRDLQSLSSSISELKVDPKRMKAIYFSHGKAKILVRSAGQENDMPFYFEASDTKTVLGFYAFVTELATDQLETILNK
ncbi:MAG: hypothetical protein Q9200_006018 [Gallowayella weberi]